MKYEEAKNKFIETWGKLGSEWGINRTMAQVHALFTSSQSISSRNIHVYVTTVKCSALPWFFALKVQEL